MYSTFSLELMDVSLTGENGASVQEPVRAEGSDFGHVHLRILAANLVMEAHCSMKV